DSLVALEEGIARPLDEFPRRRFGQFLCLVDVHLEVVADMLGARLVAALPRTLVVVVERLSSRLQLGGEHDEWVARLRRRLHRVPAHTARYPDGWMRLLIRHRQRL